MANQSSITYLRCLTKRYFIDYTEPEVEVEVEVGDEDEDDNDDEDDDADEDDDEDSDQEPQLQSCFNFLFNLTYGRNLEHLMMPIDVLDFMNLIYILMGFMDLSFYIFYDSMFYFSISFSYYLNFSIQQFTFVLM